ncbi:GumC family protein [Pedobacter sp.]|uniref:GumC family protein n=1 Tax=Pedobacter sp. TaxID=1411316 RepID=UPI003D7FF9AC
MNNEPQNNVLLKKDGINYKELLFKILAKWPWLLLSLFICLGLSYLYIQYKTPMYRITARVLVNDEKKGGGAIGGAELLGDLGGLLGGKSTVDNEAEIFKTRFLMEQVVRDLDLHITYFMKKNFKNTETNNSPFSVQIVTILDTLKPAHFSITPLGPNKVLLSSADLDTTINFNQQVALPDIGTLVFRRNENLSFVNGEEYSFSITSVDEKVSQLMDQLYVGVTNKLVSIIDLRINHPIPNKGEEVLNNLINKYVESNLRDKNEVADSTIKFINNRLLYISTELGGLEGDIQGFKQKNNLADMTEQSKLLVQNTSSIINELSKVETQLNILTSLQEYLDEKSENRVLPSSLLPTDMVFTSLIEKYNNLLLERDRRLLAVTVTNPLILNLDQQIANLRIDMLSNLISTKNGLVITKNRLNAEINKAENRIQEVPATERNYLNLARQQQIKQELYIFLMQKSEETAISKTSTISNSRTIDPPKAEFKPFSPQSRVVALIGLFFGLAIPIGLIYSLDVLNNKVRNKEDVTKGTTVPIFAEIGHNILGDNLVVANNSRSPIAEQFRALRTNLSFYLNQPDKKVVVMTSSMAGEGKSFVTINLGNILAITGKKVLLMELDLRKPGLAHKLNVVNNLGFTNYIINNALEVKDIVKKLDFQDNIFLISSGPIPPNPAETLLNVRTKELIDLLKLQFDYIIIDAPPIGIVTDAQLMEVHADLCLYVVRQNYTLKSQLKIIEDLVTNKKMRNVGVVINDIIASEFNGYGYGYGYGYGSYGNDEVKKNGLSKVSSLFNRKIQRFKNGISK